jgi:hypothetical protein
MVKTGCRRHPLAGHTCVAVLVNITRAKAILARQWSFE